MLTHERREACRYATIREHQNAVLESELIENSVRVLNESATGFLVETDSTPPAQVGDTLRLHAHSGSYEVKIAYIRPIDDSIHVGLRRTDDLFEVEDTSDNKELLRSMLRHIGAQLFAIIFQPLTHIVFAIMVAAGLFTHYTTVNLEATPEIPAVAEEEPKERPTEAMQVDIRKVLLEARIRILGSLISDSEDAVDLQLDETQQESVTNSVEPCLDYCSDENETLEAKEDAVDETYSDILEVFTPEQQMLFLRIRE